MISPAEQIKMDGILKRVASARLSKKKLRLTHHESSIVKKWLEETHWCGVVVTDKPFPK